MAVLPAIQFELFHGVVHGVSTRLGGVSRGPYESLNQGYGTADDENAVTENRRRFVSSLGVDLENVVSARLTHGRDVSVFRRAESESRGMWRVPVRAGSEHFHRSFSADGAVSDVPDLAIIMTFADCVPLLFADPKRGVIGAAHAGWRGTAVGVGPSVVRAMCHNFGCDPSDILVAIGPSIGPCCYVVGEDVSQTFCSNGSDPAIVTRNGSKRLDLWVTNERQLFHAGVHPDHVENHRICTSCNSDTFFSHRAENGITGRLALCIGCPPDA